LIKKQINNRVPRPKFVLDTCDTAVYHLSAVPTPGGIVGCEVVSFVAAVVVLVDEGSLVVVGVVIEIVVSATILVADVSDVVEVVAVDAEVVGCVVIIVDDGLVVENLAGVVVAVGVADWLLDVVLAVDDGLVVGVVLAVVELCGKRVVLPAAVVDKVIVADVVVVSDVVGVAETDSAVLSEVVTLILPVVKDNVVVCASIVSVVDDVDATSEFVDDVEA
jgi:hypothetical protein